ncbi:protein S100-A1-like [Carcharodon carcharias]|uniref:protein S100-A1-like n=1 Tax=Carcharodon carcharias TaxID=13397 RepID=UPI001B7DF7D1|nr:protein S100-A1-like [Carcharodon carcharias]XP_041060255.1 protein S100-A1-like [Carcharodon carcharias]XP_041060256.1 protein S100-A1-like [Carcharodon carcharias]XP_041060257.1 protein S100-A1-like [Carcharodon carcharias]
MSAHLTDLEKCMQTMIAVFHKYSGQEENQNKYTLSNRELKDLLDKELSSFMKGATDPEGLKAITKKLDINQDGEVNFEEFAVMLASITIVCNEFFVQHLKQSK